MRPNIRMGPARLSAYSHAADRALRSDSRGVAFCETATVLPARRSLRDQFGQAGMGPLEKRGRVCSDMMVQPSHRGDPPTGNWHVRCAGPLLTRSWAGARSEDRSLQLYRSSGRDGHGAELRSSRARRAPEGSGARRLRALAGGVRRQWHVGAGPSVARARGGEETAQGDLVRRHNKSG